MALKDHLAHALAQGPPYAGNLETVSQACVNEIMLRERMDLRLVL